MPVDSVITAINWLVLLFVVALVIAALRARRDRTPTAAILLTTGAAAVIGLSNAAFPPLVALREATLAVQPAMVLGLTTLLTVLGLTGAGRRYFRRAKLSPLIAMHGWRVLFGGSLLAAGLLGGLPPEFFWSVALGDIAIGLWALAIWRRWPDVSGFELKVWSLLGLADLLHLLPRAVLTLPPFYLAHPELERPLLLPLLGVPLLIALHLLVLIRLLKHDQTEPNE